MIEYRLFDTRLLGIRTRPAAEIVAAVTVPYIELETHDRKQHRVRAVEQLPVFDDGVESEIGGDVGGPSAVPARAMALFGLGHEGGP